MVFATVLIGFLGFMVWVHHMFATGLGPVANSIFAVATMAIAVPTGVKIFNWMLTMWGGQIRFTTAMLFAVAFVPTFVMGGVTGVMLAVPPADFQYHDSYFVVAHFHYVIVGGLVLGIFSGLFYWWPKMFGRTLSETLGKWFFWIFILGFHLTFFPQHFLGLMGMPRRVFTYQPGAGLEAGNLLSTIGAFMMGVGTIIFLFNIIITAMKKQDAPNDPWDGRTLEWTIPSPPPEYNFRLTPLVRGLDPFWKEKMAGNKTMTAAEPLGPIHMPSSSILPFVMSLGLFIAGYGFMYAREPFSNSFLETIFHNYYVSILGVGITFVCMFIRSINDDKGWHVSIEELEKEGGKG
jgi:heme/copper-type cytochrome/quinol oxidase subunit 1